MIRTELDRIVATAWRAGRLDGTPFRYNRELEQIFFHYPDGRTVYSPIILRGTRRCSDRSEYDEYGPAHPPVAGFDAVIHTHQDRRRGQPHDPSPGTKDGVVPRQQGIPNYGLSSVGAWVIRPGLALTVEKLDGQWGVVFNPEAFAAALNRGRGDVAVGMGIVCQ